MPFQDCMLCEQQFKNKSIIHVCNHCMNVFVKALIKDKRIKDEILKEVSEDKDFISVITNKIFHETNAVDVGLGGAGTIAEFFRKKRKKKIKNSAS